MLVAGSNIQIATHAPNYSNNRETIYAEDLAKAFRDGAEWADKNPAMRLQNHCVKINYPEQNKITMRVDFSNKEGGEE